MASAYAIHKFTGFSRSAIDRRIGLWSLGDDPDPKQILQLKPLDEAHAQKISLEEARTALAVEDTALKRLQRERLEGKLTDIDIVIERTTELFDGIAGIIRTSELSDDRKGDIFAMVRQFGKEWGEK